MKNFFSLFIIAAIAIGGGWYLYSQQASQKAKEETSQRLKDARRSFAERVRAAVTEEDVEAYRRGTKQALAAYFEELKTDVYGDHPEWWDIEMMKKNVDEEFERGGIGEAQHRKMMLTYELVKRYYDILKSGDWETQLSQVGAKDTRFDIFDVRRTRDGEGRDILEMSFFLWGVEPNTRLSFGDFIRTYWQATEPDAKTKRRRRRAGQDPDAPEYIEYGSSEGSAAPYIQVQDPARTIPQFPSSVMVGLLRVSQVPKEASLMDMSYSYRVRKGGSEAESKLAWDKMEIPKSWQLDVDFKQIATEQEATEMQKFDPTADAGTN